MPSDSIIINLTILECKYLLEIGQVLMKYNNKSNHIGM